MASFFLGAVALAGFAAGEPRTVFPDCVNGPLAKNGVCNSALSIAERAKALVNILTVAEKINMTGDEYYGIPRIGLPSYKWWNEGLHGVASDHGVNFSESGPFSYATSFPQPIVMGAAFDDQLIFDVGTVISTEARAFSNDGRSGLDYWTPNINQFKDPRWGRGQETPGEDSFHLKSYVSALVRGFEGPQKDAIIKIIATCKHFVGYDIEDWQGNLRYEFDAQISPQDLFEYYMQPFQTCAREESVGSFMCSYNSMNGIPTCADRWLLQTVLREHWDWNAEYQYVVSDCGAVQNIYDPHKYNETRAKAVATALKAGTDLDCGAYFPLHLPDAFKEGQFDEAVLDQAITRLISAQLKLGYFDPASTTEYRSYGWANVSMKEHNTLALRAAEKGIVLLQNDGILPLKVAEDKKQKWALIGSWANATEDLQGNYPGIAPFLHSPLWAAERLPGVTATFCPAIAQGDSTTGNWIDAIQLAKEADVVLFIDGINNHFEAETKDRVTIAWTAQQLDLIETISALNKPFIVVQMGGGQLDDRPLLDNKNISAVVWGGYPGQDGGPALMNIITGAVAPAGRLPVTQYPADYVDAVPMTDMSLRPNEQTGNPGRTYRWFEKPVLPFGYGLHYTTFELSISAYPKPAVDIAYLVDNCDRAKYKHLDLCPSISLDIDVSNTGGTISDFVLLAFVAGEFGPKPYPIKTLVNYHRFYEIAPGKTQSASLALSLGSLARHDENGNAVLYPGKYSLLLDVPTAKTVEFELKGKPMVLEEVPKMDPERLKWSTAANGGVIGAFEAQEGQMWLGNEIDEL